MRKCVKIDVKHGNKTTTASEKKGNILTASLNSCIDRICTVPGKIVYFYRVSVKNWHNMNMRGSTSITILMAVATGNQIYRQNRDYHGIHQFGKHHKAQCIFN